MKIVRVMCSGRVDAQLVLKAFAEGADGVMILGCHPGDCNYREGNTFCLRRFHLLQAMLPQLGIERQRLALDWVASTESDKFVEVTTRMVATLEQLGPLGEVTA